MNKPNPFEEYFQGCVRDFGGTLLAEATGNDEGVRTADYHFPKHNVIAELKTLMQDSTAKMNAMMLEAIKEWGGDPRTIPMATDENGLRYVTEMPEEISKHWFAKHFAEVETHVRDANKQIAQTKQRFNLQSNKGIILVSNAGNPYHNNPKAYRELLGALTLKRTATGERRFPNIDGGVYFSDKLPSREAGMPFWAPFHIEEPGDNNAELSAFMLELRTHWYKYIENTTGVIVRQHDTD